MATCGRSCRISSKAASIDLFPFEVNGCAHPAELLNQYGKELHIMGGVDKNPIGPWPKGVKGLS